MDAAAIAAGTPSFTLMRAAGAAATRVICDRYQVELAGGCLLFAGPGNNGGDAWVVATELKAAGVEVTVVEVDAPRTDDARAATARSVANFRRIAAEIGVRSEEHTSELQSH